MSSSSVTAYCLNMKESRSLCKNQHYFSASRIIRAAVQGNDGGEHSSVPFTHLKEKHAFLVIAHQPGLQLIKYVGHICCQLNTRVEQWGSVESVWLSPAPEICGNMLSLGCALAPPPRWRAVRTNIQEESWAEPRCSRHQSSFPGTPPALPAWCHVLHRRARVASRQGMLRITVISRL